MKRLLEIIENDNGHLSSTRLVMLSLVAAGIYAGLQGQEVVSLQFFSFAFGGKLVQKGQEVYQSKKPQ